jgi:hypothetical protein
MKPTIGTRSYHDARLLAAALGLALSATVGAGETIAEVRSTVPVARVLEVAAVAEGEVDLVVFSGGLRDGWREGMRARVVRGDLQIAEMLVLQSGNRVSAAAIETISGDVRIGTGDTVLIKLN